MQSLLLLLLLLAATQARIPVYKSFTTHLTGLRNVSYHFQSKQGLTPRDKQAILDIHNLLRAYIATGQEKRGYGMARQPPAANMQALSWDDYLAEFSQAWANTSPETHSSTDYKDPRFKDANAAENMSGDVYFLEVDMYGEVRWWNYDAFECNPEEQCGHYLTFVNAYWTYMGCGWNDMTLVCNFVGLVTTSIEDDKPRKALEHEYYKGPPCSMCQQGFDFCMAGGLCATKAQCNSDTINSCRCLNDASTCATNGGDFDADNCRCKCPPHRFGINCRHECRDSAPEKCGLVCYPEFPSQAYFCNKLCGGCGKAVSNAYKYWYIDRPPKNKDNIRTRAFWPDPLVTPPPLGNCKNKVPDAVCAMIATRNYCTAAEYKGICPRHCNTCDMRPAGNEAPLTGIDIKDLDLEKLNLTGYVPMEVKNEPQGGDGHYR